MPITVFSYYLSCAVKFGLMIGESEGIFRPQDVLTHRESEYLMARLNLILALPPELSRNSSL